MKYRLRDVINTLEYDELLKIKNDLDNGGFHLKQFIDTKIKEIEKEHEQFCSNCSSALNPNSTNNFTLIFGPHDFRKKTSFCGMDCMEYFLKELKQIKKVIP